MHHALADVASFKTFVSDAEHMYCWWCGRTFGDQPRWWNTFWLLERAHIVSNPRIEDRRVCVILCSVCHRVQHGQDIPGSDIVAPTVENMLWLKMKFDHEFYDLDFLGRFSNVNLGVPEPPPSSVMHEFQSRRRGYPGI